MIKKILSFPVTRIILGVVFCLGTMVVIKKFVSQPLLYAIFDDRGVADTIKNCVSFSVLLGSYFLFSKFFERRTPSEISLKKLPKELGLGLVVGFISITASIGFLFLIGSYKVTSSNESTYSFQLFTLLCTAALLEDLFIRGLMIRTLENWKGTYVALAFAMLFECLHLFNPHVTALSLVMVLIWGFTMTMLYVCSKSVWLPFFFHVGWNFAQPFYGSNLTGVEDMGHVLKAEFSGPEWLTGGSFGIEGSVFTMTILLIVGTVCYIRALQSGRIVATTGKSS